MTELGIGELRGRGVDPARYGHRIPETRCPDRTCVSPDGTTVFAMADEPCVLLRWSWRDVGDPTVVTPPQRVELPGCPPDEDPHLIAALADDVVVLDDDTRVYRFDLTAGAAQALPKLGTGGIELLSGDSGRVALVVTQAGPIIRVETDGMRIVNADQNLCGGIVSPPVASASGQWVVRTCLRGTGEDQVLFGESVASESIIVRASGLGLERFVGIPMFPLAVDDDGDALLYSVDEDNPLGSDPRGLYVLTGDGTLRRIDKLEPAPAIITNADGNVSRFIAAPIRN